MDIKWKDEYNRIINANDSYIKIKNKSGLINTYSKEDIYRIELSDGILFLHDLNDKYLDEISIPANKFNEAVKIFNDYDKTGRIFKKTQDSGKMSFFETFTTAGDPVGNFWILITLLFISYFIIRVTLYNLFGKYSFLVLILIIALPIIYKLLIRLKRNRLRKDWYMKFKSGVTVKVILMVAAIALIIYLLK